MLPFYIILCNTYLFHFQSADLAENCQLETIWISEMIHKPFSFYASQISCFLILLQLVILYPQMLEGINIRNFSIKP